MDDRSSKTLTPTPARLTARGLSKEAALIQLEKERQQLEATTVDGTVQIDRARDRRGRFERGWEASCQIIPHGLRDGLGKTIPKGVDEITVQRNDSFKQRD